MLVKFIQDEIRSAWHNKKEGTRRRRCETVLRMGGGKQGKQNEFELDATHTDAMMLTPQHAQAT